MANKIKCYICGKNMEEMHKRQRRVEALFNNEKVIVMYDCYIKKQGILDRITKIEICDGCLISGIKGSESVNASRMTNDELLNKLREYDDNDDHDAGHREADEALLEYIGDDDITDAFYNITRWYS